MTKKDIVRRIADDLGRHENETAVIFLPGEVVQAMVDKNPVLADAINKKIEERLAANQKKAEPEQKPADNKPA